MWWVAMCWNVFHCFTIYVQLSWADIGECQNPPKNSRCAVCATIGWSRHVANFGNFSESRCAACIRLSRWRGPSRATLCPRFLQIARRKDARSVAGLLFRSVSFFFCCFFVKCNNASCICFYYLGGGKTMTYDIGIFYLFIHFYILDVHNY